VWWEDDAPILHPDSGFLDQEPDRQQIAFISISGCCRSCAEDPGDEGTLLVALLAVSCELVRLIVMSIVRHANSLFITTTNEHMFWHHWFVCQRNYEKDYEFFVKFSDSALGQEIIGEILD